MPVSDPDWRSWLSVFPYVPTRDGAVIDWYIDRTGPYLARRPVSPLSQVERLELRGLLKDYANALLRIQKRRGIRGLVDVAGMLMGGAAYFYVPGLELPSLIFSPLVFARNQLASRSWKQRRQSLESISSWIQELI